MAQQQILPGQVGLFEPIVDQSAVEAISGTFRDHVIADVIGGRKWKAHSKALQALGLTDVEADAVLVDAVYAALEPAADVEE